MSSVVTQGYQPEGSLNLVVTMGYLQFAHIIPPTPPAPPADEIVRYGPALTLAERRRWFGDFESPISRAARRKTKEYLQRVEFGILPPEVKEEIIQKAAEIVPQEAEIYIQRKSRLEPDRVVNAVVRQMKSEIRQVMENRRILLDQEEEEDIVVIATVLLQ